MYKIQLIKIDRIFSILLKTIYLSTLAYPSMASFSQGRHDSIKKKLYTANNKTNNFVGVTMYLLKTFLSFWSVTRGVFREVQTLNIYY